MRRIYGWMDKHPKAMRLVQILSTLWMACFILVFVWQHKLLDASCTGASLVITFVALHLKDRHDGDDGDDTPEEDPDMPTGDAVDRWVRSRTPLRQ